MCLYLPTVLISLPLVFVLSYPYYIVTVIWHPTLSVSVAVYVAKVWWLPITTLPLSTPTRWSWFWNVTS
jgi:hypothetical protein